MVGNRGIALFSLMLAFLFLFDGTAAANWRQAIDMKTGSAPLDVTVSRNGRWIYVLTEGGKLMAYTPDGVLNQVISVDENIDGVQAGPMEDVLLLSSGEGRFVRIYQVDLLRKIDVSGAPFKGPANAPVEIIVFTDYRCGYCYQLQSILEEVHQTYPEEVKIISKSYPLSSNPNSTKAAIAAKAAAAQGKYFVFHERLFKNSRHLTDAKIGEIALETNLNMDAFEKKRKDPKVAARVRKDKNDGKLAGVTGVPAVFINGKRLKKRTLDGFHEAINGALMEKGK